MQTTQKTAMRKCFAQAQSGSAGAILQEKLPVHSRMTGTAARQKVCVGRARNAHAGGIPGVAVGGERMGMSRGHECQLRHAGRDHLSLNALLRWEYQATSGLALSYLPGRGI
jgi:hypothetical protein